MPIEPPHIPVGQRKQTLNMIWYAMVVAVVGIYWSVPMMAAAQTPHPSSALMITLLATISFVECVGAWVVNHMVLTNVTNKLTTARLAERSIEAPHALGRLLQNTAIVSLAFFEAVTVCGLVVGSRLGSSYPNTFEWFAGIGVANLVLYRFRVYPVIFQLLDRLESIHTNT